MLLVDSRCVQSDYVRRNRGRGVQDEILRPRKKRKEEEERMPRRLEDATKASATKADATKAMPRRLDATKAECHEGEKRKKIICQ